MGLADLVPVPARDSINTHLHSASETTMLDVFGRPGELTANCSALTNPRLEAMLTTANVGPFDVTGLRFAVESLRQLFAEVKTHAPEVYHAVKTDGMFCCRHKRRNARSFSNHSWGTAIDLFFGGGAVDQGTPKTQVGVLDLYPYFHAHGWYWGAGFSGASVDSMHFEVSEEMIRNVSALLSAAARNPLAP